ncbi:MAG: hypothetical protein KAV87_51600 [Desulfobacteraceae bacterium]|nr:hypothetical protein [Desulfobacteraceae bacterium]
MAGLLKISVTKPAPQECDREKGSRGSLAGHLVSGPSSAGRQSGSEYAGLDEVESRCLVNTTLIHSVEPDSHGEKPLPGASKSQYACYSGRWSIKTWRKDLSGDPNYMRFRCNSWRHAGPCRKHRAAEDFARISQGLSERSSWTYIVLTYADRTGTPEDIYALITRGMQSFRQWLTRQYGKHDYIILVEQHKDGFPHVNMLIHNTALHLATAEQFRATRRDARKAAIRSGFGKVFWIDNVDMSKSENMAGYLAKLGADAQDVGKVAGELGKVSQVPLAAPKRFRRLRASRGLLPKKYKNEEITGEFSTYNITYLKASPAERLKIDRPAGWIPHHIDRFRECWQLTLKHAEAFREIEMKQEMIVMRADFQRQELAAIEFDKDVAAYRAWSKPSHTEHLKS